MRCTLWLSVLLLGCGSSSSGSGSGAGSGSASTSVTLDVVPGRGKLPGPLPPPVAPGEPDLCELGKEAIAALTTCNGQPLDANVVKAKQQYNSVIAMAKQQRVGAGLPTTCAQVLRALDDELAKIGCPLPLSVGARARMYQLIDAWYATRTAVTPTGNAVADAKLATIAAVRDQACACKTTTCFEALENKVDAFGAFDKDAPPVAVELAGKLLDDIARCSAAITKPVPKS